MKSYEQILSEFKKGKVEIELLETLCVTERSKVATDLGITYDALTKRIETLKKHAIWYEWYTKQLHRIKRTYPFAVGLLAPKKPTLLEEEEF